MGNSTESLLQFLEQINNMLCSPHEPSLPNQVGQARLSLQKSLLTTLLSCPLCIQKFLYHFPRGQSKGY